VFLSGMNLNRLRSAGCQAAFKAKAVCLHGFGFECSLASS
jgi:hypothetical protein